MESRFFEPVDDSKQFWFLGEMDPVWFFEPLSLPRRIQNQDYAADFFFEPLQYWNLECRSRNPRQKVKLVLFRIFMSAVYQTLWTAKTRFSFVMPECWKGAFISGENRFVDHPCLFTISCELVFVALSRGKAHAETIFHGNECFPKSQLRKSFPRLSFIRSSHRLAK